MKHKHFNQSRILKRTLVVIPSAALLVGFAFAQTQSPQPSATSSASPSPGGLPPPVPAASPLTSSTPVPHFSKRNLSVYDKASPLAISKGASQSARGYVMAQVRSFIFDHFQGHKHGYLQLSHPDLMGITVQSVFFIELDVDGNWSVTIERNETSETFHVVEQISVPADGRPPVMDFKGRVVSAGGAVRLHLKQNAESNSGLIL